MKEQQESHEKVKIKSALSRQNDCSRSPTSFKRLTYKFNGAQKPYWIKLSVNAATPENSSPEKGRSSQFTSPNGIDAL